MSPRLLVVVPAHDEVTTVAACLHAVQDAGGRAVAAGAATGVHVALVAHRCTDGTGRAAAAALGGRTGVTGEVVQLDRPAPVGAVRNAGARVEADWLFSTDADTLVPPDWILDGLRLGARTDLLLGLVDLAGASPTLRARHQAVVDAGVHPNGSHQHAYAANLAVRMGLFVAVGGFPAVPHGEEHVLAERLRAAGHRVASSTAWRVRTSARTRGRAATGLSTVLAELSVDDLVDVTPLLPADRGRASWRAWENRDGPP